MQTPPRCDGVCRIARLFGSPFLRLKQVDISAAGDVEGMVARADHSPFVAHQAQVAAAHRAEEHSTSVTNREFYSLAICKSLFAPHMAHFLSE